STASATTASITTRMSATAFTPCLPATSGQRPIKEPTPPTYSSAKPYTSSATTILTRRASEGLISPGSYTSASTPPTVPPASPPMTTLQNPKQASKRRPNSLPNTPTPSWPTT